VERLLRQYPGAVDQAWLGSFIRDVPDFPSPGITFKDLTPLLADARAFEASCAALEAALAPLAPDAVVGIESRGFLFAAPLATRLRAGLVLVRKPGKLPWTTVREEYALEYGTDALEIHDDAIAPGARVVLVDDVLATGGTAAAAIRLVERVGGQVVGCGFLIELAFLSGRPKLGERPVTALLEYS
jgi:adenine phosphoribosyltransferase